MNSSASPKVLRVGCRASPLSLAQVEEVRKEFSAIHPDYTFEVIPIETIGDIDQKTSLRNLEKTDFFTREIELRQLQGEFCLSIHSAKDLPATLQDGLEVIALTKGVDPSDALVLREGETFESLPPFAKIGTSSIRRENNLLTLRKDLQCIDIRGPIHQRLELLEKKEVDGVVIAEAALIRLQLTHLHRIPLPGECASLQGQLALVAHRDLKELAQLFSPLDSRCQ